MVSKRLSEKWKRKHSSSEGFQNCSCLSCFCSRSWRVCLCLRCRRISAGWSSSSVWSAQSKDTMIVRDRVVLSHIEYFPRFSWIVCLFTCPAKAVNDHSCSLPVEEAGIIWDSICLLFLLLQRRVFLSFYFLHVVTELQASAKQASRYDTRCKWLSNCVLLDVRFTVIMYYVHVKRRCCRDEAKPHGPVQECHPFQSFESTFIIEAN